MNITPGPFLVKYSKHILSEYGFDSRPASTRVKSFFNYTIPKINILSPSRAWYIANVRHFNFIKSYAKLTTH